MSADSGQGIDKGGLTIPAADVSGHDLQHGNGRVCTEKGKRGALATGIAQEDPADGQGASPSRCYNATPVSKSIFSCCPAYQAISSQAAY